MKSSSTALSIAALFLATLTPALGHAQSSQDNHATGVGVAQQMVPARASITHGLDSNNVHAGDQFRATLSDNVHLDGGVDLRRGDALVGEIVTDDTNTPGKSHLAVRFTQAVLKNGQTIPIKATIVALYSPGQLRTDSYRSTPRSPQLSWSDKILSVDQFGVVNGVDLHSRVASQNSGVFVSEKNNIKIPGGSEIALAIAPQGKGSADSDANLKITLTQTPRVAWRKVHRERSLFVCREFAATRNSAQRQHDLQDQVDERFHNRSVSCHIFSPWSSRLSVKPLRRAPRTTRQMAFSKRSRWLPRAPHSRAHWMHAASTREISSVPPSVKTFISTVEPNCIRAMLFSARSSTTT